MVIEVDDMCSEDLQKYFEKAFQFIEEGRKNGKVLVHCAAGISRSSTVVVAYMMKKKGINWKKALEEVQSKHSMAYPNMGFRTQLQKYQAELGIKD